MKPADLRAVFLSSDRVYIRSYVEDDKHVASAWAGSPFPVGSPRGEQLLKDWHTDWWPRTRRYALCRASGDEVVGGVTIGIRHLVAEFVIDMASWVEDADELRAAAFELVVPWLADEWSMVSVTAYVAADQPETRSAAERLDMTHQVTLREYRIRPGGDRVDMLLFQRLENMEAVADA